MTIRVQFRWLLWNVLKALSHKIKDEELAKPAIVFSPHPDDETLGCGGTIIRKKRAGARVKVVFMTDGSSSHRRFISEQELKKIRTQEALSACNILGVDQQDVIFLNFRDQCLSDVQPDAVREVVKILRTETYDQIFMPCATDGAPDHDATNAIVSSAARDLRKDVTIYEYLIWFWRHWPWTGFSLASRSDIVGESIASIRCWLALIRQFRCLVPISEVLEQKYRALQQHQSQMVRPTSSSIWPILSDLSDGEFLQLFFRESEVFSRRVFPNNARS